MEQNGELTMVQTNQKIAFLSADSIENTFYPAPGSLLMASR
jgi:hypothetical protein